jgi:hypothetical protein
VKGVPWNDGKVAELAVQVALEALATLDELDAIVGSIDKLGASVVLEPLLRVLFGPVDYGSTKVRLYRECEARIQATLRTLARWIHDAGREIGGTSLALLDAYGLFDLPRQVGLVAPRPLDGDHDGEPRWSIARRVRDGRAPLDEWRRCLDALPEADVLDIAKDLAMVPFPYRLPWRWRTPTQTEEEGGGAAFGYGYDAERAAGAAYDALQAETLRRLSTPRLEECLAIRLDRQWTSGLPILVESYLKSLRGAPVPERFAPLVPHLFDDLHATPEALRARVELVGKGELARVVDGMPFNLLVTAGRGHRPHVYLRQAFLLADQCPSDAVGMRAVDWLAKLSALYPGGYAAHAAALTEEAISALVPFFAAFGAVVIRRLREVKPASREVALVLEGVASALERRA